MNYREERRRDKAAEAEQRRADAQAQAEADAARLKAQAEVDAVKQQAMSEVQQRAERDRRAAERQAEKDKQAAKERRQQRRKAAHARAREWAGRHVVELLIYPIALVSFALAAPAMADYGAKVYDSRLGWALPLITELGMWAFALAVQVTRHRHPQRPVWALQLGVWTFSGVAFGLNLLHGLDAEVSYGVVMGVVAIAGVVAHQLTVAAPPRSRDERAQARITRREARKVARIRKAAVDQAAAEVDADGQARLVYRTGRVELTGRVRPRLGKVAGRVDPDGPGEWTGLDHELAALVESTPRPGVDHGPDDGDDEPAGGGVATLDRNLDAPQTSSGFAPSGRPRIGGRPRRSMDQLRAELADLIEARQVDPDSAESIRSGLGCAKAKAQQLRDELRQSRRDQ